MHDTDRWVFFDIGYTLVNEDAVWDARCREQAALSASTGITEQDVRRKLHEVYSQYGASYRRVLQELGCAQSAPYRSEYEQLYPEAAQLLRALRGRYRLGVIANQSAGLEARLGQFGILQYFDLLVSSAEAGCAKPDPGLFAQALHRAGCSRPRNAVMVGDRIDHDIIPASRLGMRTVRVRQGLSRDQLPESEADATGASVRSLSELPLCLIPMLRDHFL